MIYQTYICASCRKNIELSGKGGQVWVRGDFQFCSKECYETLERCSELMTEHLGMMDSDLRLLQRRLMEEGLVTQMHRSYMSDMYEGESARIEEDFWKRLEEAGFDLEKKRLL